MPVLLPKGIHCPRCHSTAAVPTSRRRPTAGRRDRYFCCTNCGCRFKTVERIVGVTRAPANRNNADTGTPP